MATLPEKPAAKLAKNHHPFRRAVLRGLGVVLPPLLTIVIFLWVGKTINDYGLIPAKGLTRYVIVWFEDEIYEENPHPGETNDERKYIATGNDKYIPNYVYEKVRSTDGAEAVPATAEAIYERYVEIRWLPWWGVIPIFLSGFLLVLFLLGRFLAAGVGRFLWNFLERVIHRLPIIRNVYSSVKQVTDFVFSERDIEYTKVVAVEYPRKGVWSLGFVTGESMLDIHAAANEPVLSVLIPTSPMPVTGYTITVRKSETLDLDITIDQAFQFTVSCGVVVPPQQLQQALDAKRADDELAGDGSAEDGSATPILAAPTTHSTRKND